MALRTKERIKIKEKKQGKPLSAAQLEKLCKEFYDTVEHRCQCLVVGTMAADGKGNLLFSGRKMDIYDLLKLAFKTLVTEG